MKKLFLNLVMAAAFLAPVMLTSCDKDDNNGPGSTGQNHLSGTIIDAVTLDASKEYLLTGPLIVEDGGVLTIPAGTTIKARKGFNQYILVLQGGKIFVNGTAANPVTMTSADANPDRGDWGGLIINGRAPLTIGADGKSSVGTTEINTAFFYGGDIMDDNSGSITYLKLMYTGSRSNADVEHNGLTLNGVGNGTTINNIFVYECGDDGIEFFGGSVNVTNLLVVNTDDDMFDITQGWSGTLTNAYGIWEKGFMSTEDDPRGVEADGNHDGNFPTHARQSNFTIRNMTIELRLDPVATDDPAFRWKAMQDVIKIRRGAIANIENALVKGIGTAIDIIDMTDGRGAGNPNSTISITNALTTPFTGAAVNFSATQLYDSVNMFGNNISNLKIEAGNAGCDPNIFAWTGYRIN